MNRIIVLLTATLFACYYEPNTEEVEQNTVCAPAARCNPIICVRIFNGVHCDTRDEEANVQCRRSSCGQASFCPTPVSFTSMIDDISYTCEHTGCAGNPCPFPSEDYWNCMYNISNAKTFQCQYQAEAK